MKNFLITQGCGGTYSIIGVLGGRFNNPQINHHLENKYGRVIEWYENLSLVEKFEGIVK
tara:strand:- start:339 stop:515 length:177 start_codon:yes stop_codon:yes gene_type:complete